MEMKVKTHKWEQVSKAFNVVGQHITAENQVGTSYQEFIKLPIEGCEYGIRIMVKPSTKLAKAKDRTGKEHDVKTVILDVTLLKKVKIS